MICMVTGNTCHEPSHLQGREDLKLRPLLNIYTCRDPSVARCTSFVGRLHQGVGGV